MQPLSNLANAFPFLLLPLFSVCYSHCHFSLPLLVTATVASIHSAAARHLRDELIGLFRDGADEVEVSHDQRVDHERGGERGQEEEASRREKKNSSKELCWGVGLRKR